MIIIGGKFSVSSKEDAINGMSEKLLVYTNRIVNCEMCSLCVFVSGKSHFL